MPKFEYQVQYSEFLKTKSGQFEDGGAKGRGGVKRGGCSVIPIVFTS